MALTGQAKVKYQREYMRRRRSNQNAKPTLDPVRPKPVSVRPEQPSTVRPVTLTPSEGALGVSTVSLPVTIKRGQAKQYKQVCDDATLATVKGLATPAMLKPEILDEPEPLVTIKPRKQFTGEFTKAQQVSRKGFNN